MPLSWPESLTYPSGSNVIVTPPVPNANPAFPETAFIEESDARWDVIAETRAIVATLDPSGISTEDFKVDKLTNRTPLRRNLPYMFVTLSLPDVNPPNPTEIDVPEI